MRDFSPTAFLDVYPADVTPGAHVTSAFVEIPTYRAAHSRISRISRISPWRDRARRIVVKDGIIVEVTGVVGVEGSRVLFGRYLPLHDTVLKTVSCKTVSRKTVSCSVGSS